MLRRLHNEQPESFAFTPDNQNWAEAQVTKYPEGRQASAIIALLWRAQEQEGWLTRPAIEYVADMLGLAYIRGLEVATFYFMFQLQPVGSVANIQVCGTTSCMICGAEDLISVCRERIAAKPHELSADGKFSWEEVECLGACSNAPMAQIGKDYYEDLTAARLGEIIDELAAGKVPVPGPQNGRYAAEPLAGLTSLTDHEDDKAEYNASVQLAVDINDTVKRIDGTEVPLLTPWVRKASKSDKDVGKISQSKEDDGPRPAEGHPADKTGVTEQQAAADSKAKPPSREDPKGEGADADQTQSANKPIKSETKKAATGTKATVNVGNKPGALGAPRDTGKDDLKRIKGVGPKLESLLNSMGFYHYDQIAKWDAAEVAWVDQNLEGFKGRVSRDNWVDQASQLAKGEDTEISARTRKDDK